MSMRIGVALACSVALALSLVGAAAAYPEGQPEGGWATTFWATVSGSVLGERLGHAVTARDPVCRGTGAGRIDLDPVTRTNARLYQRWSCRATSATYLAYSKKSLGGQGWTWYCLGPVTYGLRAVAAGMTPNVVAFDVVGLQRETRRC